MGWYERTWDVAKLAGTVGVDRALHEVKPPWDASTFAPVLNEVVVALVSAAIVLVLTNGLFERPRVRLAWQRGGAPEQTSVIRFAPVPTGASDTLHVTAFLEGRSALARLMKRFGFYDGLVLRVEARPPDALRVTDDARAHARAGVVGGGFVRMSLTEFAHDGTPWVGFTIELNQVPQGGTPIPVNLQYVFVRGTHTARWFDQVLLRRTFGVATIQAIRQ